MTSMISKIRKLGRPGHTPLDLFNQDPPGRAVTQLLSCCGSRAWATKVAAMRPFKSEETLITQARGVWFALPETDWLEAFACHPRIGEKKAPTTKNLSYAEAEQAAAQQSLAEVAVALAEGNRLYQERFGFIYIVFASGRSAPELLEVLNLRLTHTRDEELQEAAGQQLKITNLRIHSWLNPRSVRIKP
jgi:OHCU decarboxylase